MRNVVFVSFLAIALSACGSSTIDISGNKNVHGAIEAATGPLQDLNLRQQEIPLVLVNASNNLYAHKKIISCDDIKSEVNQLDEVLGADRAPTNITYASANEGLLDHARNGADTVRSSLSNTDADSNDSEGHNGIELPDRATLIGDAGDLVRDKLFDVLHSQTNILPFRSIIRHISGAAAHQKQLEAAFEAGKLRRAYLTGVAEDKFGPQCLAKPIILETKAAVSVAKAEDVPAPASTTGIAH